MSLKPWSNFFYTISFRLFFWYAVLFVISCILLFAVVYHKMKQQSIRNVDNSMQETVEELKEIFNSEKLAGINNHMKIESEISQQRKKFFRLFLKNGSQDIIFARPLWNKLTSNPTLLNQVRKSGKSEFETIQIPGHRSMGRIMYAPINDDIIIQMGFSMSQEWRALRKAQQMFIEILLFVVLPLAAIIGWFMAKHALREVKQLNVVAGAIANGSLEQRMLIPEHPTEVSQLAITFNAMMDKLQLLIAEEQEITDNIAHDLRSPLTRLKGEVEVMLGTKRSAEDYQQTLESILEEVNNLQTMLDNILDISAIETAVLTDKKELNLNEFLRSIIDIFIFAAEDKQLKIELQCPEHLVAVFAPLYMQRAIANLLDNAIKYSNEQNVIIVEVNQSGQNLTISITDHGIGIAPHDIEKIFQRFYRGESCRSTPGNGLGLALATAIVNSHDGTLTVDSIPQQRTTFTIIFKHSS